MADPQALTVPGEDIEYWSGRIRAAWQSSVTGIIETGRILIEAKDALAHGEWLPMVETLPFKERTARCLMAIARDPRLVNRQHVAVLPPSWGTLYELTRLTDERFNKLVDDGTINPECERRDIATKAKKEQRRRREVALAEKIVALPDRQYGVIYADPEWRFEPYSRETGMDRSADNHYPTNVLDVIKSRDVRSIAAKDCVLFLWATVPTLPQALEVMDAWDFEYKSHLVWVKDQMGTGYWFRNLHELLLVGVRGNVPAPAMGDQYTSVIMSATGLHSEKPRQAAEIIEAYFPNLPKIELNCRGAPRPGWDAWGNEAQ